MTFQDNLRHYREKAGYAQAKDFAAAIGVKYSTYIGYENQGREPKYDTLRRIAEALNVSIDTLLGFSGVDRYEEYKQILERLGYHIEERGDGYIKISTYWSTVLMTKVQISDYIHNALDILDRDLVDVKITYIRTAMYQLLHTDNLGFADLD